ncbi:MAG: hypothetical protein DYG89_30855 [Caldilinea sp. CFX5]|nr:hypothetical protein [Caldilinea sp. CFX5]
MPLLAGAARVEITPPLGLPMAGYPHLNRQVAGAPTDTSGYFGRNGAANGVLDPLYARALVLANGRQTVALLALDLIVVTASFTAAVRQGVAAATGIPGEQILVSATHTHSGPDLFWADDLDPTVTSAIVQQAVAAICQAHANRQPARCGWSDRLLDQITINRRDPGDPIEARVGVMVVTDAEDRPLALAVNFPIHPIVLSATNLHYSGDVPGLAMAAVERLYPGAVALFLNGAAGNINPVAYPWGEKANLVPVFRQAWHAGLPHPRTYRNATRLAHILASEVIHAVEEAEATQTELVLAATASPVALPMRPAAELAQFRAFMGLGRNFDEARLTGDSFASEVQALAIGPRLYIGLPGEPFVELSLALQQRLAPTPTYVLGYSNDDPRYILHAAAYQDNRYETWGSLLLPGSGELLLTVAEAVARHVLQQIQSEERSSAAL